MVEIIEKKNWKIEYKRDLQIAEMVFANWKYNLKDIPQVVRIGQSNL